MASPQYEDESINMVTTFIDNQAPNFHQAFAVSASFNRNTMTYEPPEIRDLRETLLYQQQRAKKYVDFTSDLTTCSWDQVHQELKKAQAAALETERRGRNPIRKAFRAIGNTSSVLAPGLSALPDDLCILHGALALIFSLARHSELNRTKILGAFENVPNIIEMARTKAETFPLDSNNTKSVQLHKKVRLLQDTLIKSLPPLINKLVPSGFLSALQSPFGGWNIDRILDEVKTHADSVRICAEGLIEELIVGSYSNQIDMKSQLNEIIQQQRMMIYMSMDAASQSKTHLFTFFREEMNFNNFGMGGPGMGYFLHPNTGRGSVDQSDLMSERGTALLGYTAEDLLKIMDVSHLRNTTDEFHVLRRYTALPAAEVDRASRGIMSAPAIKDLINVTPTSHDGLGPKPGVVSIDGRLDRNQITKITSLSYVCATLSQALRQQSQQQAYLYSLQQSSKSAAGGPGSPTSPLGPPDSPFKPPAFSRSIVLTYFCALHTSSDDPLSGPQGLLRCLTTQLLHSLLTNELISPTSPLDLPHLTSSPIRGNRYNEDGQQGESEDDLLNSLNIHALSRLFSALVNTLPVSTPIFIIIDSLSSYERDELNAESSGALRQAYDAVLDALITSMDAGNIETGGNCVRIVITSPTRSRWLFGEEMNDFEGDKLGKGELGLEGYLLEGGRISLRGMGMGHGHGYNPGGNGVRGEKIRSVGIERASTLPVGQAPGSDGVMEGSASLDMGYQPGAAHDGARHEQYQQEHVSAQYAYGAQDWGDAHDRRSSA
ncbi:hypothetical protein V8F06_011067 [Rhypophila decipiens]